jgi:2-keto-3-deoxy-L-rhamnonate aldolase RhmA
MDGSGFLRQLKSGKRLYGTAVSSGDPLWPAAVKRTGVDFVFIDTEHTPLDRATVARMCLAYTALGLPPLVRIPSPDPYQACQVLDAGAAGVLAPYIEDPEPVKSLVGAMKLRPLKGQRLATALDDPASLEPELRTYLNQRNAGKFLLINVESVPALERLDRILAVPGLDGVIIGPHDLSVSLAVPEQYTHPRFEEAVARIVGKVSARGLAIGIHFPGPCELQVKWAQKGVNIILHSSDAMIFEWSLARDIRAIRKELREDSPDPPGEARHTHPRPA